jgi:hypothetical protein
LAEAGDWSGNAWWVVSQFLQGWIGVTLIVAIVLTVYSLLDYLWSYRTLIGIRD